MNIKLRFYQEEVFRKIREAINQGYTSILVVMPCRSGKTPLAAYIVEILAKKKKRVLFNVHRSVLIEQTHKLFNSVGIEHGIISPYYPKTNHLINIGSIASVYKRLESLPENDVMLHDEAHRDMSKTRKFILDKAKNSIKIGFTATPCRLSNEPLGDVYQIMILGPSPHDLIQWGFLCDFITYSPPCVADFSGVSTVGGEFNKFQLDKATNKNHITGDAIKHYKDICPNAQMVVFTTSIRHAENVCKAYNDENISARILHSKMSKKDIESNINAFANKEIKILVNVDMITEGFDCKGIEAVQILCKTKSVAKHIQMITRGMTIDPNNPNKITIILDHVGNTEELGQIDDEFNWTLDSYSGRPVINNDGEITRVKVCGKCYHTYKPHLQKCPLCGSEKLKEYKPLKVIDRQLEIIKSTNKKVRELVGENKVRNVGIETLKERLQLLIDNNISSDHKDYIKIERRIEEIRADSVEKIIDFAKKYGMNKYWAIRRYSFHARGLSLEEIEKIFDNYLETTHQKELLK